METPKQKVENYLKTDRTLRGGKILYNQLPGKNKATALMMRNWQDTPQNIEKMCFHLAKAVGLEDRKLKMLTQKPVTKAEKSTEATKTAPETTQAPPVKTPGDKLMAFDPEKTDYQEAKKLVKELKLKPKSKKKADIFKALAQARKLHIAEELDKLPQEVKASIKLRDQFPFLREADCPDVLKLLVSDLINSYERFKENQPELHEVMDAEQAQALVDTVKDSYIENKQAFEELEHYGKTKELLGNHPIFKMIALKEDISQMNAEDLNKKINALKANLSRNKQKGNQELVDRDEKLLAHALEVLKNK